MLTGDGKPRMEILAQVVSVSTAGQIRFPTRDCRRRGLVDSLGKLDCGTGEGGPYENYFNDVASQRGAYTMLPVQGQEN